MTFWQGECSLCSVGCEEWVLFLKFHTCDRREGEREKEWERKEAGGIESSLGLSQHLCTFSSLSLLRFLTVDSDWERNLPPVVLHKNTKMYCHTPHTFFSHTQAFSRTDTFFSMFYALSISFKHPIPPYFSSSHKYLPSNTHKQQFFTFVEVASDSLMPHHSTRVKWENDQAERYRKRAMYAVINSDDMFQSPDCALRKEYHSVFSHLTM